MAALSADGRLPTAASQPRQRTLFKWTVICLVPVAFALRLYHVTASGLWFDEVASYLNASHGFAGILAIARSAPGENPPAYYWILYGWMQWAGSTEFALRFVSVWFGVLFVALFARFARHYLDFRLALLATLLSVPLPILVSFSQEARNYTLVLCPTILAMDYFLRWLRGEKGAALAHLLFILLAVGVHYYALLIIAAQDIYILDNRILFRRLAARLALSNVIVLAALATWLVTANGVGATATRVFGNNLFAGRSPQEFTTVAADLALGGNLIRTISDGEYFAAAAIWMVALLGIGWAHRNLNKWSHAPALRTWIFSLMIVPPLLASPVPHVFTARHLFVVFPALIIVLACGLMALSQRSNVALAVGGLTLAAAFWLGLDTNYNLIKNPYRDMAAIIRREANEGDGLILDGKTQEPLAAYYLMGSWDKRYIPDNVDAAELVDIDAELRRALKTHERLWVVSEESSVIDPGDNVARWLGLNAYPVSRDRFKYGDSVALYLSGSRLSYQARSGAQFSDLLMLDAHAISTLVASAGDAIAVQLSWHALKPIPENQRLLITLRLFDQRGMAIQERVSPPCDGFCPLETWVPSEQVLDRHGFVLPADMPTGEYVLRLEVYAPRQRLSLPIVNAPGPESASLELARLSVRALAPNAR
jgi:hypothetical protein